MQNKERQIATQSQLKVTLDWANACGKCLTLKELVSVSVVLVDYVENGWSAALGERLSKIDEHFSKPETKQPNV